MKVADGEQLKREILMRSMFPSMPAAAHARFVDLLDEQTAAPGDLVFNVDDPPDRFFFLTEGQVAMEREGMRTWSFTPHAVVGVIDALLERQRTRNCRALEPSRLLSLKAADWFDLLEDNGQVARSVIRNFATQLHGRWQKLAPRLTRQSEAPAALSAASLETYDRILILRRAPSLRSSGMQAIASLASLAEPMSLRRGELLFDAGAHHESWYFVAHGSIELTTAEGFHYSHQRGDLIGGPAALCGALPGYSARATSDAVLLRIAEQDFYDQAEEHGRLTRGTLKYLVSELEPLLQIDDGAAEGGATPRVNPGA